MRFYLSRKLAFKIITYFILIFIIPPFIVNLDRKTDIENTENLPFYISINLDNSSDFVVELGEIPVDTIVSLFIDEIKGFSEMISIFAFEETEFNNYRNGVYNLSNYTPKIVLSNLNNEFQSSWFNFTTQKNGVVKIIFLSSDNNVNLKGFYQYDVTPYIIRNLINLFVTIGIYFIFVISIIPYLITLYYKNKFHKSSREKRMAEEEEFYSKYRDIND